jgi:ribonuclease HI
MQQIKNLPGRKKHSDLDATPLLEALRTLNIPDDGWDIAMIADGSGTGWGDCGGWGGTLVEKLSRARRTFYGGTNCASVNMMEAMTFFHGLTWYHTKHGKDRLKRAGGILQVRCLTDSRVTCSHAHQALVERTLPSANVTLWAGLQALQGLGYNFSFHWIPRDNIALHWLADLMAGTARKAVKDINFEDNEGNQIDPYAFNQF